MYAGRLQSLFTISFLGKFYYSFWSEKFHGLCPCWIGYSDAYQWPLFDRQAFKQELNRGWKGWTLDISDADVLTFLESALTGVLEVNSIGWCSRARCWKYDNNLLLIVSLRSEWKSKCESQSMKVKVRKWKCQIESVKGCIIHSSWL